MYTSSGKEEVGDAIDKYLKMVRAGSCFEPPSACNNGALVAHIHHTRTCMRASMPACMTPRYRHSMACDTFVRMRVLFPVIYRWKTCSALCSTGSMAMWLIERSREVAIACGSHLVIAASYNICIGRILMQDAYFVQQHESL